MMKKKKNNNNSLIIAGVVLVVIGIPFVLIIANRAMTASKQKKLALEASEAALQEQEEAAKRAVQAGAGSENAPHEDASGREKASGTFEEQLTEEEKQALWVEDIAGSAFQKLIDAGELEASPIDEKDYFRFDPADGDLVYLTEAAKAKYTADGSAVEGKVIWGSCSFENGFLMQDDRGNSPEECDYLLLFTGLISRVDENYYNHVVDRKMRSTHVFVIDAHMKEVVHIEFIGADCPGVSTSNPIGKLLRDDAIAYMRKLTGEE